MHVEIMRGVVVIGKPRAPGMVLEVRASIARELIGTGHARAVDAPTPTRKARRRQAASEADPASDLLGPTGASEESL